MRHFRSAQRGTASQPIPASRKEETDGPASVSGSPRTHDPPERNTTAEAPRSENPPQKRSSFFTAISRKTMAAVPQIRAEGGDGGDGGEVTDGSVASREVRRRRRKKKKGSMGKETWKSRLLQRRNVSRWLKARSLARSLARSDNDAESAQ